MPSVPSIDTRVLYFFISYYPTYLGQLLRLNRSQVFASRVSQLLGSRISRQNRYYGGALKIKRKLKLNITIGN